MKLFNTLFKLTEPYSKNMVYWRGKKGIAITTIKRNQKFTGDKKKKSQSKDGFLLVVMRLRLVILNEDVADRFCIPPIYWSNIFKMLILLSKTVKKLVAWYLKNLSWQLCRAILKQLVMENHGALLSVLNFFL